VALKTPQRDAPEPQAHMARPPPGHAMQAYGAHVGPSLISTTHAHLLPPEKNQTCSIARVLAHFTAIFDLLARNSIFKTVLGDFSSVCDSSNGSISFCSSGLLFAHLANVGDHVLELACPIYMV
jgi:hypothetical protein